MSTNPRGRQSLAKINTQLPAKEVGGKSIKAFFESRRNELERLGVKGVSPEKMMQLAYTALRTNDKLQKCTVDSLYACIIKATQLGLQPNTPMNHCYIVPYGDEATLQMGYPGLIQLAVRAGNVTSVRPIVVYENDDHDYDEGTNRSIRHRPVPRDRGEPVAYYAIARNGSQVIDQLWMWKADCEEVRDKFANTKRSDSPWKTHFDAMALKTVIIRLCKYLPRSPELGAALELEDRSEAGQAQNLAGEIFDGEFTEPTEPDPPSPPPKPRRTRKPKAADEPPPAPPQEGTTERPPPPDVGGDPRGAEATLYQEIELLFQNWESPQDLTQLSNLIDQVSDESVRDGLRNDWSKLNAAYEESA